MLLSLYPKCEIENIMVVVLYSIELKGLLSFFGFLSLYTCFTVLYYNVTTGLLSIGG